MLVVPNNAEVLLLSYMLNATVASDVRLKLYSNNKTPVETDVLSSYVELVSVGYIDKVILGSSWVITTVSGVTTATYATQTFSFPSGTTAYGYYVTNNAGTDLLWAERFSNAPINISPSGTIDVNLNFAAE